MAAASDTLLAGLTIALAPIVAEHGAELETVTVTPAGKRRVVRVVVDADGGVSLDAVAEISRAVSDVLDSGDLMGAGPFVLEVTSPGVDRPLTEPKHWRRATGRLVTAVLADGLTLTGRVLLVDTAVTLDVDGEPVEIAFELIHRARVEVEFSRPDGSTDDALGDSDAADDDAADEDPGDHDPANDHRNDDLGEED